MKRLKYNLFLAILLGAGIFFESALQASSVRSANTEVELISETATIKPAEPFWVAVRLNMDQDWDTYWKNPGDSGLAARIEWKLPEGFKAGSILWPFPERIDVVPLTSYGYHGEIFLLTQKAPTGDELDLIYFYESLIIEAEKRAYQNQLKNIQAGKRIVRTEMMNSISKNAYSLKF